MTDEWFTEKEAMWPGQRFGLQIKKMLHEEKSEYQDIKVFDSTTYGRVLILDGVIQLTERDEFAYQEMIAHLPMFAHPNPENVLIVGGGDGGVLREVMRHKGVKRAVMCEIDQCVVEVSKKFFGSTMATAFSDPRATVKYMDAAVYMKEHFGEFDVIIVDSSDPVGPAETLYTSSFYRDMFNALRDGGVVCTQGECQYLHLELIRKVMEDAKAMYPVVDYGYSCVPTYPDGQIGYIIATKSKDPIGLRTPKRAVPEEMRRALRYYNEEIHRAAFVLPQFAAKRLEGVRAPQNAASSGSSSSSSSSISVGAGAGSSILSSIFGGNATAVAGVFAVVGAVAGYVLANKRR